MKPPLQETEGLEVLHGNSEKVNEKVDSRRLHRRLFVASRSFFPNRKHTFTCRSSSATDSHSARETLRLPSRRDSGRIPEHDAFGSSEDLRDQSNEP